jgi:hypothetical protein
MKGLASAALVLVMTAMPAYADCKAEVDGAFAKLREAKAFRMASKIVNPQGTLNISVDYMLPDRMHQRVRLGESPAEMETIAIGEKVWSNQGQGWAEVPENFAGEIVKQIQQTVAAPSQSKIVYSCLGDKEFEGKTYAAYSATLPAAETTKAEAPGKPTMQTLYIDKSSGLPARNIVAAEGAPDQRLFDGTFSTPTDVEIKEPSVDKLVPNP